jgi:subtilisin-like proprotein convertase family protein
MTIDSRSWTGPNFAFLAMLAASLAGGSILASAQTPSPGADAAAKPGPVAVERLGDNARQQIIALAADKATRTPAQRKISSRLLYSAKARRGMRLAGNVSALRSAIPADKDGRVDVEIAGRSIKAIAEGIEKAGGKILFGSDKSSSVRARVPIDSLEDLAAMAEVRSIHPSPLAITHHQLLARGASSASAPALVSASASASAPGAGAGARESFEARADRVRDRLRVALDRIASSQGASLHGAAAPAVTETVTQTQTQTGAVVPAQLSAAGAATSEGDVAHRAAEARNFFGVTGAGAKIGVLSDSVDFLAQSQASGDLPADVIVLPGQSGEPGSGEGTAMLEIVHDLAPGAKLYFATAFSGIDSFADNIRALRAAGCDIIVDDVIYAVESPFQDGIVARAVDEVTADGAIYFSSAGNEGNVNDGTSSVWEGDYKLSTATIGALDGAGDLHDFGSGVISDRVESSSPWILGLFWSDPAGGSGNDYDLYILNNTLTTVLDASTDVQDGDDDPFEATFPGAFGGERIVIVKYSGAARALHVNNFGGQLGIATSGSTHGHNSAAKAFGVAAIDAATAGGGAFTGGPTNPIELYSSDGNRRVFFDADGNAFKPGNFLFRTGGGQVRNKPDVTGADGAATTVPGFQPFYGTSAAAPHAAAIAGLLKSARPNITPAKVRQALTQTALDIEAAGRDRDSGYGIVDAFGALQFIGAPPAPYLDLGTITASAVGGDGDAFIEPGESATLLAGLVNVGGATALTVRGALTTSTPGVTVTTGSSTYPNIGSNGQTAVNNTPFRFSLAPAAVCGLAPEFTLTARYSNGANSPQAFTFRVPTGQPGDTPVTTAYAGAPAPIPDATTVGVSVPLAVSGASGAIAKLTFAIDGSACSSTAGSTTVGLDHTWVGDLVITLTSPHGTTVTLANRPGGVLNGGNNFCGTVFDDAAATSIQDITSPGAPYTGTFSPATPLSAFLGEDPNGTWTLGVTDLALSDTGSVRAFSLTVTSYECGATTTTQLIPRVRGPVAPRPALP